MRNRRCYWSFLPASSAGDYSALGKLAERERFELAVRVLIQRLRGARPPHKNASANAISRGDSVAILEKQKAAPKGGFSI